MAVFVECIACRLAGRGRVVFEDGKHCASCEIEGDDDGVRLPGEIQGPSFDFPAPLPSAQLSLLAMAAGMRGSIETLVMDATRMAVAGTREVIAKRLDERGDKEGANAVRMLSTDEILFTKL